MKNKSLPSGVLSFLASVMAILLGMLVGLFILLVSNPAQAMKGFTAILLGGISNLKNFGQVLYYATPIIMTGLSVGFASKTGLFNIGASGQFIVGAFAAVFVGVKCTFLPGHLHWIVALLAAALCGALWGMLPGILKAYRNVNVVIACIMMNYIGMYAVNALVSGLIYDPLQSQSLPVADTAILPKMGMDMVFRYNNRPSSANAGIVIAILSGIVIYIILQKTVFGYELKACGYNSEAGRYAGMNEKKNIVLSMAIAGALSGLGGGLLYLAGSGNGIQVVDTLAAEGFNGIPVALLAMNNPIGVIFAGLFIAYLKVGGDQMQLYKFVPEVIDIIISVIIYFSAFALVFRGLISKIFKNKKDTNANAEEAKSEEEKE